MAHSVCYTKGGTPEKGGEGISTVQTPTTSPRYARFERPWGRVQLVKWCFEPSQPLRIISGLKETFIKRHIVERTNKSEVRPEELSEKTESCRENLWNEIQLKGGPLDLTL